MGMIDCRIGYESYGKIECRTEMRLFKKLIALHEEICHSKL